MTDLRPLALPAFGQGPHVFLSGPMGVGKSTLAQLLGTVLGRPVLDLDRTIEARIGESVPGLFRREGEAAFRVIEADIAREVAATDEPTIFALGGGTVTNAATRAHLIERGTIVTLQARPSVLAARLADSTDRPLLADRDHEATLAAILASRLGAYAEAHVLLPAEARPEMLVPILVQRLEERPVLVPFGLRSYRATFGAARIGELLPASIDAVLVVADPNTEVHARAVLASVEASGRRARLVLVGAGEHFKNLASLEALWDAASDFELTREGAFVAVGGGVIGDLTGLAAATWLRGVAFGVVPTTLLSMADSAIGGKTAIDRPAGKNLVGAFHQPAFVRIDVGTLSTLPERERRSGLAEVAKCAWLAGEGAVAQLERDAEALARGDEGATLRAVEMAARVKARIVAADETETGARRALNLGHTLGHAFESASEYELLHGEAVSLGMIAAGRVAVAQGALTLAEGPERMTALLGRLGLPTDTSRWLARTDLERHLRADKKRSGDQVRFVLPGRPGTIGIALLDTTTILANAREFGSAAASHVR